MAAPFLTGNVTYLSMAGVTDVNSIITQLQTTLLALSPAWTNPSSGKFVSPVDSFGRQMTLQFNRISATNLEMVATDGSSRSSTRRAQIAAGGSAINVYAGQFHLMLDWINSSGPQAEGLYAFMMDESPELQTSHNMWLAMNGARTNADALDGAWRAGTSFFIRSAGSFADVAGGWLNPIYNNSSNNATNGYMSRTQGGSNLWCPVIQMGDPSVVNNFLIYGKYYACLITRANQNAANAEVSVPIDQANSAIFRVTNMPFYQVAGGSQTDTLAVRKT